MNMIPCEVNSSLQTRSLFPDRYISRPISDSKLSRPDAGDRAQVDAGDRAQVDAGDRAQKINDGTDDQDFKRSDLDPRWGSKGDVNDHIPHLSRDSNIPSILVSSDPSDEADKPRAETIGSPVQRTTSPGHRQRSKSTVDSPHLFLTDPAVNRPQVAPTTVESLRAKMFRQKKDLAPRWSRISNQDPAPWTYDQKDHSPDSPSRKPGNPDLTQSSLPEAGAHHSKARRSSVLPFLSNRNPEFGSSAEVRPRSTTRGLSDFFRFRKKSVSSEYGPGFNSYESTDGRSKSPQGGSNSKRLTLPVTFKRQRSKSTVEAPNHLDSQTDQVMTSSEPISVKVFNFRRDSRGRDLMTTGSGQPMVGGSEGQHTPMSGLLSKQVGPSDTKPAFGIMDFLELYKNHSVGSDSKSGDRSPQRRISDIQEPSVNDFPAGDPSDQVTPPGNLIPRNKASLSLQSDLPETIPEYLEVNQVRSSETRQRRRHMSPSTVCPFQELDVVVKEEVPWSRRFSEPPTPNNHQLGVLNSIRMKLISSSTLKDTDDNDNIVKNVSHLPAVARSLGLQFPMTSHHKLFLWKDKENEAQLLKLPINCNDSYNLGFNDKLTFVKLMKKHKCHELMPQSAMLVLLDSELKVISAFYALMFNEIKCAPIWETSKKDFIGMLTVTDFINVLRLYYHSPEEIGNLDDHKISDWMKLLHGPTKPMISVDPDDSLFDAACKLATNRVHRVLVADSVTGDALYVLGYRKLLQYIYLLMFQVQLPSFMDQSIEELNIGTYDAKVCTVNPSTRLIDALNLLIEKRVSALPVITDEGHVVNIYAKVDAINLAINQSYTNLDCTVQEALEIQRERFEGVYLCKRTDTLQQVTHWIIQENIHRMVIVDDKLLLAGIISLSDIVRFLVIKQFEEAPDFDIQPGDIDAELDITL